MKNDLNDKLQILREAGKTQDEILYFLSLEGLPITDAIIAVRKLYGIGLEEAKKLVASSQYWERANRNSQVLHDALEEIADKCGNSEETA